ncbi:tetratricopeptide repeat protein [Candidatus Omnitrophota bacterium]
MKRKIIITFVIILVTLSTAFTYHFTQQADINYYQGHRLFLKGKYEKAIPFYAKAIEEGSDGRDTYKELGYCYLWTGKSEKSIQLFEDVAAKKPDDYKIKDSLAEAYSWNRNYAEAIKIFKEIVIRTNSPGAKEKLAEVYLWNGQPEEAKMILESLVIKYPDNYKLQLLWGKALYYTGESEKASRVFEELLKEENEK